MENAKGTRKYLDLTVILAILLVAALLVLSSFLTRREGATVTVEINGTLQGEYSLFENGTYVLNGGTNTLVIENGRAYIVNSSCPDHTCENTGKVHYVGQTIVCLPNKLSVTVVGEADDGVDLVS